MWLCRGYRGLQRGLCGGYVGYGATRRENQMEKNIEDDMETGFRGS